jgi:hypothetical protein
LDVLYHGSSLSKNKKDLRLITFDVINQGDTSILSNFYDPNDPVGFSIVDGKIADEPILIGASNSYLEKKLEIEKISDDSVLFSNVILEPGEFFKIKILVLHEISKNPTIKSFGKVAGVNNVDVLMDFISGSKRTFLEESFGGGVYPNVARFFAFSLLFILLLALIIATFIKIYETNDKRRKNKLIKVFKEYDTDKITEKDNFFFDYYLSSGADIIKQLFNLLAHQERLNELLKEGENSRKKKRSRLWGLDDQELFSELMSEGFITVDNDNDIVTADAARLAVITDFFNYLKRKGEFKRSNNLPMHTREMVIEMDEHN